MSMLKELIDRLCPDGVELSRWGNWVFSLVV